ncbi:helix-turn-helix transcriptional regulator [Archangium sp.]|uniref:helix-turn-helix domain-containing protein n=1 Tax=Archangium sp. TaxID=1872627 RepID=UPI00286C084A|nr:helix-turn-helix transcriptional regulator [Archangium sp.]
MDNETLQRTLGEAARAARERLGLTQAQVARQTGIAPNVYGRIERGGMMPAVPTLRKLVLALGISADVLLDVKSTQVAPSLETPVPGGDLTPEMRQIVRTLRGWPRGKVKLMARVVKTIDAAPPDEA